MKILGFDEKDFKEMAQVALTETREPGESREEAIGWVIDTLREFLEGVGGRPPTDEEYETAKRWVRETLMD